MIVIVDNDVVGLMMWLLMMWLLMLWLMRHDDVFWGGEEGGESPVYYTIHIFLYLFKMIITKPNQPKPNQTKPNQTKHYIKQSE